MKIIKYASTLLLAALLVFLAWWFCQTPSINRNWTADQMLLANAAFSEDVVNIENVRNFKYSSVNDYQARYYDRSYRLSEIESLYYIIEPFSTHDGPAHTMMSFGFSGGVYVTISAEIRKEQGESFDPLLGLMNQYELVYIVGDENDLVKLRANHRKDPVIMYPIKAEKADIQALFVSMLQRANTLSEKPEFYNTLYNTCTTNILSHVNALRNEDISWGKRVLLPSHSDEIIYNLGLIDTKLPLSEARSYYTINDRSDDDGVSENDYSKHIRTDIR